MISNTLINIVISYLIGSISGSLIMGKIRDIDIRNLGSGNAGGTNAFRTQGLVFALTVVIIDVSKGFISAKYISDLAIMDLPFWGNPELNLLLCGMAAVVGHVYPIYHGFKGGKGAGAGMGMILALDPTSLGIAILHWLVVLILTGFVGLGTMVAGIVLVIVTAWLYPGGLFSPFGYFSVIMALFIIYTHRSNIARMYNSTENKFEKAMIFKKLF